MRIMLYFYSSKNLQAMKYIITCLLISCSINLYAQQTPKIKDQEKQMVISKMKKHKEVREALIIEQEEIQKLSLALIVSHDTSKERAMELGAHFLRNAMNHIAAENKPGEIIGKTLFDYMVSVCTDRNVIVMGTKIPGAETISW